MSSQFVAREKERMQIYYDTVLYDEYLKWKQHLNKKCEKYETKIKYEDPQKG